MSQKGFVTVLFLIGILIIALSGVGIYFYLNQSTRSLPKQNTITNPNVPEVRAKDRIAFIEYNQIGNYVFGRPLKELGQLLIEDIPDTASKKTTSSQINVNGFYGWSFDNKYIAIKAQDLNQINSDEDHSFYYGVLNVESGQIKKLPIQNIYRYADDIEGWISGDNLLFHSQYQSNISGNQDFTVYSSSGDQLKKFTLVTPKSKDNNAYFDHHISPDGSWLTYQASRVGESDGIEVLDHKLYSFNLKTFQSQEMPVTATQSASRAIFKDGKQINSIESKSHSFFGYIEYAPYEPYDPSNYSPLGIYRYEIYKYINDQLADKPEVTITYDQQAITQTLRILSISPDGQYIAYSKSDEDTRHLSTALYITDLKTNKEFLISTKTNNLDWAY